MKKQFLKFKRMVWSLALGTTLLLCTQNAAAQCAVSTQVSPVSCFGGSNGAVQAIASGGVAPYVFAWSTGSSASALNSDTIQNLAAGSYSVTITDANGCVATESVQINEPTEIQVSGVVQDAVCALNNGSIQVVASGGTPPYVYSWNNGAGTASLQNLASGTYVLYVADASGCYKSAQFTVNSLSSNLVVTTSVLNPSSCNNNDGFIHAAAGGGIMPYSYLWNTGENTTAIGPLAAGNYAVSVTDGNGCTAIANVVLQGANGLSIATLGKTDATCGQNNGMIANQFIGGNSPYNYIWSNGASTNNPPGYGTVSNLNAGIYTITVTDVSGCSATASYVINDVTPLYFINSSVNPATCGQTNGAAAVFVTGGSAPYSYSWSDGTTSPSLGYVAAGSYTLTIADANGCVRDTIVVVPNVNSNIMVSVNAISATCGGSNDGSAAAIVSGGVSPYTYLWSNGATGSNVNNLIAGNYILTVTDVNGCSSNITFLINNGLTLTSSGSNVSCFGGANGLADVAIQGGTAPFTYQWNNGQTSTFIQNLLAGVYTVTVTDANGCSGISGVTIQEPNALITGVNMQHPFDCNGQGGVAAVFVSGGNTPYNILWSNGSTSTINNTIVPNQGVNGVYTVTVTDGNGCSSSNTVTVANSCDSVWPGDANSDLTANYIDFLNIALSYNATGTTRSGATTSWVGQVASNWSQSFTNGVNYKHADCNGDGTINLLDADAILNNYGQVHNKNNQPAPYNASLPDLYLLPTNNTAGLQQTVNFDIYLGSATKPVDSIYAIAFKLNFESNLVFQNPAISYTNSWLGDPANDLISFEKSFYTNGYIDVSVGGNNQLNRSGSGKIGTASIVTTDNLSGIAVLHATITDVKAVYASGETTYINSVGANVTVDPLLFSIQEGLTNNSLQVYPNPANEIMNVSVAGTEAISEVRIINALGQIMFSKNANATQTSIDASNLSKGIYTLSVQVGNKILNKRITIAK